MPSSFTSYNLILSVIVCLVLGNEGPDAERRHGAEVSDAVEIGT